MEKNSSIELRTDLESKALAGGKYMIKCIKCHDFVSYYDVIKTGFCPNCGKDLTSAGREKERQELFNAPKDDGCRKEMDKNSLSDSSVSHSVPALDEEIVLLLRDIKRTLAGSKGTKIKVSITDVFLGSLLSALTSAIIVALLMWLIGYAIPVNTEFNAKRGGVKLKSESTYRYY